MLISLNKCDRYDLQVLQNNALRICYNVRLIDRVSVEHMHNQAILLSLDQRRQKQVLSLLFIYKNRHEYVRRVYARNTRAANVYTFARQRFHNIKYKNSSYFKGSLLWDMLPVMTRNCLNVSDYLNSLKRTYSKYNDKYF